MALVCLSKKNLELYRLERTVFIESLYLSSNINNLTANKVHHYVLYLQLISLAVCYGHY